MKLSGKLFRWMGIFVAATVLTACGGGGGESGGDENPKPESSLTVIPSLGVVTGATVNIYESDGTTLIGSGDPGSLGQVTITFSGYSGPVVIEVAGNSNAFYFDVAKGSLANFPTGTTLHAMAPTNSGTFAVTPLTELAYQNAVTNQDFPLDAATVNLLNGFIRLWFVPEITDLLTVATLFDSSTTTGSLNNDNGGRYALRLAALARLGNTQAAPMLAVLLALIEDMKDGVIDGKNGTLVITAPYVNFAVELATQLTGMATSYGTTELITAVASYTPVTTTSPAEITATANTTAQNLTVDTAMTSFSPLVASGGVTPYTYFYTGTLPEGLSFSASTGVVTGTPTVTYATADLIFSVQDANNIEAITASTVSFTVEGAGTGTSGQWTSTGSMATVRSGHTATLLANGKVLVAEGANILASGPTSTELYDPATGLFTPTGSMATVRYRHTATLLPDGKVLVTGGSNLTGYLASAELYDPETGLFTATGSMATGRIYHTATLLPNGKVLVTGGSVNGITGLASAELYDPATGLFTATGSMAAARLQHTATLLPNGKVLLTGGVTVTLTAELYDPATGLFTPTGSLVTGRVLHTATLLLDGKVLVTGGLGALTSVELYDPATGLFTATGSIVTTVTRYSHTAILLPIGKVLVTGGIEVGGGLTSAELYDPVTGLFTATGSMATGRVFHTATLLPTNGKVLVTGGGTIPTSAELYQ